MTIPSGAPPKKRRGRGKGVKYVFGNSFKNPLHFTGSTFYQDLREECSLKTKTSNEHGNVEVFVCKFSRKKHLKSVLSTSNLSIQVIILMQITYMKRNLLTMIQAIILRLR